MAELRVPSLRIAGGVQVALPGIAAYAVAVRLPGRPVDGAAFAQRIADALSGIDPEVVALHPRIAPWRAGYRAMGLKPSEYRSSIEQLVRRRLAKRDISTDVWSVDLYNLVSLAYLAPMGGYDLAVLTGDPLVLRMAEPDDRFDPLGGDPAKMPLTPKIACYAQGRRLACWAINHRDSRETALTPATATALFVSEALDAPGAAASIEALDALVTVLREAGAECGAVETFVRD